MLIQAHYEHPQTTTNMHIDRLFGPLPEQDLIQNPGIKYYPHVDTFCNKAIYLIMIT